MDYYVNYDESGNITGFYTPDIHNDIPKKCIKVTKDEWKYLVAHQAEYMVDVSSGILVWCGRNIDVEQETASVRAKRDRLLVNTDWMVSRHNEQKILGLDTTITEEQYTALLKYRQELRDIPSKINLKNPSWPTNPIG